MAFSSSMQSSLQRYGLSKKLVVSVTVSLGLLVGLVCVVRLRSTVPAAPLDAISMDELGPAEMLLRRLSHLDAPDAKQELFLRMSAGSIYHEHGKYADAATQYSLSQDLASQLGDDEQLVEVWTQLSRVRLSQGRAKDAALLSEKALDLLHKPGSQMADADKADRTANVLHALGNAFSEMGHIKDAIETYGEAWHARATAPNYHEQIPKLLSDIGDAYLQVGMLEQASDHLNQALQSQKSLHRQLQQHGVAEGLDSATVQSRLAHVQAMHGDAAGARDLCNKALRVQMKLLRAGHPDLIRSRMLLAHMQRDLGNASSALQAMMDVEKTVRLADPESQQLRRVLIDKADLFRELGKLQQAEKSMKEVFAMPSMGSQEAYSPDMALAHQTYGSILHDQGLLQEANRAYTQALLVNEETVGHWHPQTAAAQNSLGTLCQDLHRFSEARQHFEACLNIQLHLAGDASPDVASTYSNIATVLYQEGDRKGAAELLRRALRLLDDAKVPHDSPDRTVYAENLKAVLADSSEASPDAQAKDKASASTGAPYSAVASPLLSLS